MLYLGEEPKVRRNLPAIIQKIKIKRDLCYQYILSVNSGGYLVLWDSQNKTAQLIANQAQAYAAQFLDNSDNFIWQARNSTQLTVQTIQGKIIKTFNPGFLVYNHRMSKNLSRYIAADQIWNLYRYIKGKPKLIKSGFHNYFNSDKPLELSWHNNEVLTAGSCGGKLDQYPISAGLSAKDIHPKLTDYANQSLMNCVVLWDLNSGRALYKFHGNVYKISATLSPNGKYIISIDENTKGYLWKTNSNRLLHKLYSLRNGRSYKCINGSYCKWDNSNMITPPRDFYSRLGRNCFQSSAGFATRFIN